MGTRQLPVTVGLVAVLGLTLSACGDDAGETVAAKATAPVAPSAAASPGQQAAPAASSSAAGQPSAPASAAAENKAGGQSSGGGSRKCAAADLKASIGPGSGAQTPDEQGAQQIELTNRSKSTCTMKGYPGLDLVGPKGTWSLARFQAAQPELVTLQPGGTAYVVVDYLPGDSDGEFKVDRIVLTPPDDTSQLTVQWTGANPADQSGATHPVTYVRPVSAKP
ncbi:DUF4232 domain-containing protein [Kitasatospora sp. NPDC004531]